MSSIKRYLSAAVGVALAAASLTACTTDGTAGTNPPSAEPSTSATLTEEQLYEAAKAEGTVAWYSESSDHGAIKAFEEKYPGVKVEFTRLPSGQLSTRFSQEASSGSIPADLVLSGDRPFMADARTQGWMDPAAPNVPAFAEWPTDHWDDGVAKIGMSPTGIAYNTDLVKPEDVPTTWEEAINPKFGNFAIADPTEVGQYLATAVLWRELYGDDFLKKIAALHPDVQDSSQTINQNLASGATTMALMDVQSTVLLLDPSAPVKFVQLTPTTGNEFYIFRTQGGAHPNAGLLLMNYLLSEEGNGAYNQGLVSPLGALPGTEPLPDGYETYDQDNIEKQRDEVVALLGLG